MQPVRERLTRREINLLLRRERGSKRIVAERAGTKPQNVSRWLRSPRLNHRRVAIEAEAYAFEIAEREKLSESEVYVDDPRRRSPIAECGTERKLLLA